VVEICRYPVKSLQGERLDGVEIDPGGLRGDRTCAIFDAETGFGLTARRVPELLYAAASLAPDGAVTIRLPDGSVARDDTALSDWLGRRVRLRQAADTGPRRYENPADFEDETGRWEPFDGSPGAFHDSAQASVSLLSRDTIRAWDPRRFRANLLLDGGVETELDGRAASIGTAVLDVGRALSRCVMTTRPQPGGIERDLDVLRTIHREHGGRLAVRAVVRRTGRVRVGDVVG
jgi:uncharacterized protein YcbX